MEKKEYNDFRNQLELMIENREKFFSALKEDDSNIHSLLAQNIQEKIPVVKEIKNSLEEMGKKFLERRIYERAILYFYFLISLEPQNDHYWLMKGITEQESGLLSQALQSFGQAVHLDPENYYAYLYMVENFVLSGDLQTAKGMFKMLKGEVDLRPYEKDKFFQTKLKELEGKLYPKQSKAA